MCDGNAHIYRTPVQGIIPIFLCCQNSFSPPFIIWSLVFVGDMYILFDIVVLEISIFLFLFIIPLWS